MKEIHVLNSHWVHLQKIIDGFDGIISVAENNTQIPFDINRVYYIYNLINHKKVIRGEHAHKETEQVLFCINGSCKVLLDDGKTKQEVLLDKPNMGLYLGVRLWHTMYNFQNNCILLVFASEIYKETDYIRDYDAFLEFINIHNDLI